MNRHVITINTSNTPLFLPINNDGYPDWDYGNICRINTPISFNIENDLLLLTGFNAIEHPDSWNKIIVFNGPNHLTIFIPSSFPAGREDHITLITLNK